ncbi:MAG TPA: carbamoyltransferase HypF [Candidatus Acidoferrales bacterium]|nr:carbamoyltransferase HypF [Candidatus Acidoferrales bacterium]
MPADAISNRLPAPSRVRVKVVLRGAVQGVGFRPFVHRLATEMGLTGWVNNSPQGVFVEVESERPVLELFLERLQMEKPSLSFIQSTETTWLDLIGYQTFEIRASDTDGDRMALVLPDIATCPDCLREIFDPRNRRFRYPFTNCTHCGPRFSIIEALPYDRANTAMKEFVMCPACQSEYDDPRDRRFHAQPNACPACGPQLEYWEKTATVVAPAGDSARKDRETRLLAQKCRPVAALHEALLTAAKAIRAGKIVAVKGLGGFHLMADARNEEAVQRLRERKHREEKPFALLFPTLASAREVCELTPLEERLLVSPAAPIVLLAKRQQPGAAKPSAQPGSAISQAVAPNNPNFGLMLPSNPIHHLLMAELGHPVVATSGNLSDEPICTDELEAIERLHGIADGFLAHNRPIVRHVDDSIVRVMLGREMILRRARGYAPLPVSIAAAADVGRLKQRSRSEPPHAGCHKTVLAVGAHLKNAVALAVGDNVFVSQHIGDLETTQAEAAFRRVTLDLQRLYAAPAEIVAADLHPDYISTKFALEHRSLARDETGRTDSQPAGTQISAPKIVQVQHHIAHALSCLAENEVELPALGVAWDGTGLGTDGTIWGGEFFLLTHDSVERVASLRSFRLPGSDTAVKEPRRAALGMLFEAFGDAIFERDDLPPVAAFSTSELRLLKTMLNRGLNSPRTSSLGRWFDGVASLIDLRQVMRFEGQAAMELEFALAGVITDKFYELPLVTRQGLCILDWLPAIQSILLDKQQGVAGREISARFHNTLAEAIVAVARRFGQARVALSGGCFQNRYLLERTVRRLRAEKFQPYWHQRVPTNDGGIALGQVLAALRAQTAIESQS